MANARRHIVMLSRDLSEALAVKTPAGWLLPFDEPQHPQQLTGETEALLKNDSAEAQVVHVAPLIPATPGPVEYYVAMVVDALPPRLPGLERVATEQLLGGRALFSTQAAALERAWLRQRHPSSSFDSVEQVRTALRWAERELMAHFGGSAFKASFHRSGRHRCVGRVNTTGGSAYFKAGCQQVSEEVRLTEQIARVSPALVPGTIAFDDDHDRWLCHELSGHPLTGKQATIEAVESTVVALAVLQRGVMHESTIERQLRANRMNAHELLEHTSQLLKSVADAFERETSVRWPSQEAWERSTTRLAAVCDRIDNLGLPLSLVPTDLWGPNILSTPGGICFIDFEHAFWSYPWLGLRRLIRNLQYVWGHSVEAHREARTRIEDVFVAQWEGAAQRSPMRAALKHFDVLAGLLGLALAWREMSAIGRESVDDGELPLWFRARYLEGYAQFVVQAVQNAADL